MNHPARLALIAITTIAAPAVSILSAQTTTLLNESFSETVPSGWDIATASGSLATSNTVGLDGYALVFTSGSGGSDSARSAYATFAGTTLASAGDTLTVSFDFKGQAYSNNNSNRVTFGFFNSGGTPATGDDVGYVGLLRADARTDRSPAYSSFRALDAGPQFAVSGYTGAAHTASITAGSQFYLNGAIDGETTTGNIGNAMQFTYSISRMENDDLLLSQTFTNTETSASFTSTTLIAAEDVLTYTFDTLSIGSFRTGTDFAIDNVLVTHTAIPEPGMVAGLAGFAALGMAAFPRARRRRDSQAG